MADRIIIALLSPRTWLLATALCLAGWAVVGYHQDQQSAALALGQAGASDPMALTPVRQTLLGVSLSMLVVAGVLSLPIWSRKNTANRPATFATPPASDKAGAFQPIRTQEELAVDEKAKAAPAKGRLSRVVTQFAESVFSARSTSKNQP